jgi:hypothetical protein
LRLSSTITFTADGSISIMLEANGGRLACTLATAPGSDRGTYVCH